MSDEFNLSVRGNLSVNLGGTLRVGNLVTIQPILGANRYKGDIQTDGTNWFLAVADTTKPVGTSPDWIRIDFSGGSGLNFWLEGSGSNFSAITPIGHNSAAIIRPSGTGAIQTSTSGNSRGTHAVDLQISRVANDRVASGNNSVIGGGISNTASGFASAVLGGNANVASGGVSAVLCGNFNGATGDFSVIGNGNGNVASGDYSCIPGGESILTPIHHSTAVGKWNNPDPINNNEKIFMVGFGNNGRTNLFSVTTRNGGTAYAPSGIVMGTADLAEWMESSGKRIPRGTGVVIENGKVRSAKPGEIPFGVISSNPGLVGNSAEENWVEKYLKDDSGKRLTEEVSKTIEVPVTREQTQEIKTLVRKTLNGKTVFHYVTSSTIVQVPVTETFDIVDEHGNTIGTHSETQMTTKTVTETRFKLNPKFDPEREYIPRSQRPEWNLVGLLGQIPVLNDQPLNPKWQNIKKIDENYTLMLVLP